jgi:hypothetical protein
VAILSMPGTPTIKRFIFARSNVAANGGSFPDGVFCSENVSGSLHRFPGWKEKSYYGELYVEPTLTAKHISPVASSRMPRVAQGRNFLYTKLLDRFGVFVHGDHHLFPFCQSSCPTASRSRAMKVGEFGLPIPTYERSSGNIAWPHGGLKFPQS